MRTRYQSNKESGFTLIELLVVIGILAILLAITIIAINPTLQFQNARNSQRQSDVTAILDAVYEYTAANAGTLPTGLSGLTAGTPYALATVGTNKIDLCTVNGGTTILAPTYIADLPSDPSQTTPRTPAGTTCYASTSYTTGYTITKSASGNRFTVSAPLAENSATISVTR